MFKIKNVNVLLALNYCAMNQQDSDILCCPQDVNTNKFSQFNFALCRSFLVHFPPQTQMLCLFRTNSLFSTQNHNQPATTLNWAKLDTFQAYEICLFRCPCLIGMQHPKHAPDHPCKPFSHVLFSSKIKRQKDAISPQRSLLCACAGLSRDTFEREKNNGFENCAKFHIRLWDRMIFLQIISIIRKCYPSLFAHFHNTLLHIILIFPHL
jgi:hypothetical protein